MEAAIAALPPDLRIVFIWRDLEGLSTAETAEVVGISVANVKVRLHRARLRAARTTFRLFRRAGAAAMSHAHEGCHDLLPELSAYLDGEAAADLCARIDAHLAECEDCRVVVDTLTRTVRLYHALPAPMLSAMRAHGSFAVLDLPAPE